MTGYKDTYIIIDEIDETMLGTNDNHIYFTMLLKYLFNNLPNLNPIIELYKQHNEQRLFNDIT